MSSNEKPRPILGVSTLTSGVTLPSGGVVPARQLATKQVNIVKHTVEIPAATLTVTAAVGGAADGQGMRIVTLPQGKWLVLAVKTKLDVTPAAGVSSAASVVSVGTAAAADGSASLATTKVDVMPSTSAGAMVAATKSDVDNIVAATAGIVGSTSADTPLYLNLAGTWLHATLTSVTIAVAGTVELTLLDLGNL